MSLCPLPLGFLNNSPRGTLFPAKPLEKAHVLQELAQNINRALSREELLRAAWGYICPGATRTVDVHVQRLRKKLGFSCIETVYRQGYKLRAQEVY